VGEGAALSTRLGWTGLLATSALLFAIPASQITHESFSPLDAGVRVEGREGRQTFTADVQGPLFLEYGLIVRGAEDAWPNVVLDLNGQRSAVIATDRLYASQSGRVSLPAGPIRAGTNDLHVAIDGSPAATFELWGRIQNYSGIAPDFPRAFVVPDEAAAYTIGQRSPAVRIGRFGAFALGGLLIGWVASPVARRQRSRAARSVLLASPSIPLWVILLYGSITPLHVWLSLESLLICSALGGGLAAGVWWLGRHRAAVLRYAAVGLITLLSVEGALRVVNRVRPSFIFYADPAGRFRGQPGAPHYDTRLNSGGFNDIEHPRARPANVRYRIVALGDSFAAGIVPYQGNYLTLLERELAPDGSVDVINMGVSGTGPADYLGLLLKEGLAFEPDLVLVGFFVGNDFESPGRKAYEYSYLATFARALWQLSQARVPAVAIGHAPIIEYSEDEPILPREKFLEIEVDRSWIYQIGGDRLSRAAARAAADLREMQRAARGAGADLAVVIIPSEVQLAPELQADVRRASGAGRDDLDFDLPNRVLAAELARDEIAILDLLPAFREEARGRRLYRVQDTHWNLAGNRFAAARIAAYLQDRVPRLRHAGGSAGERRRQP